MFAARLRITALRGSAGPGVELLEYLAPSDGRPSPHDLRPFDNAATETTLVVADAGGEWISPGAVETPGTELGFVRGALVRDADGHFIRFIERG